MADWRTPPLHRGEFVGGQAARTTRARTLAFESPKASSYRLAERTATLLVRLARLAPGESHVLVDASRCRLLFDAVLYLFPTPPSGRARDRADVYLPR